MDTLKLIGTFRDIAHHGSFSKAALASGISKANASKYMAELEERLGVRLLNRSTRSVSLTDAGELLLLRSEPLMDMMESARNELLTRAQAPSGRLRLSMVQALHSSNLGRVLAAFAQRYPQVHLSTEFSNRRVDLVEEAVDLAIRVGPLRDSDLIVRKLRRIDMVVVATPGYWATHGKPAQPQDLSAHPCLVFTHDNSVRSGQGTWQFVHKGKAIEVPVRGQIDSTDGTALLQFAMANLGVAYTPRPVAQAYIQSGELEVVLGEFMPTDIWMMAVYAQRKNNSAALRALLDFLVQHADSI